MKNKSICDLVLNIVIHVMMFWGGTFMAVEAGLFCFKGMVAEGYTFDNALNISILIAVMFVLLEGYINLVKNDVYAVWNDLIKISRKWK